MIEHLLFNLQRFSQNNIALKTYDKSITYKDLIKTASSLPISKTDRIVTCIDSYYEWIIIFYACLIRGALLISVSPNISTKELETILNDTDPNILFYDKYDYSSYGGTNIASFIRTGEVNQLPARKNSKLIPQKTALIIFTSGSTGESKGVCLSRENLLSDIKAIVKSYYHPKHSIYLHLMPFSHIFGVISAMTTLYEGGTLCLGRGIKNMLQDLRYFSPTALDIIPEAANYLLIRIKQDIKITGGNLKTILCGGAQVNEKIILEYAKYDISVYGCYGMTECGPCVSFANSNCTPGSAGFPLECNQVNIGKDGQIYVKGKNIMIGYLNGDNSRFINDWFRTGDFGYINEKGELFITGRADDLFTLENGQNITFTKLKSTLLDNPAIIDVNIRHIKEKDQYITKIFICIDEKKQTSMPVLSWIELKLGKNFLSSIAIMNEKDFYQKSNKILWRY